MKNLLLLAVSILFLACGDKADDQPTIVKGQITDYYTGKPLPYYHLVLHQPRGGYFGSILDTDTIPVDSNGNFSYSFTRSSKKKNFQPSISGSDSLYENYQNTSLQFEKTNTLDIRLKPCKILVIRIHNVNNEHIRLSTSFNSNHPWTKRDTTLFVYHVSPESTFSWDAHLYQCSDCTEARIKKESVWVENKDTTFTERWY